MRSDPARVPVRATGGRDYTVVVAPGCLDEVGRHAVEAAPAVTRWAVVADATVAGLYGERTRASLERWDRRAAVFSFPAGERHKTRATWADLTDRLLAWGLGRDGGVVALGGGVSGDVAGFVAATYMRGIPVLQVPTSIVAMVDSAVGGKTGVDVPAGKNLVGAFHPPVRVVVDPTVVSTLPVPERAQGLAEAAKHGAIVDAAYARELAGNAAALLAAEVEAIRSMVLRSVEIKADVVSRDERESGLRETLNFGHTLGHALEAASGYGLGHGSAVAVGMVLEARLGEALGLTAPGTSKELAGILEALSLPTRPPAGFDPARILKFVLSDKKVRRGRARYVLLESLGSVHDGDGAWARPVDEEQVRHVLASA